MEFKVAGVEDAIYHSTNPGFKASNFAELESFFRDTLPLDVERTEANLDDCVLVSYTSVFSKDGGANGKLSIIYVLRRSDNSFAAAYCEQDAE